MLTEKSAVRPFFNMAHQRDQSQAKALANSVLCFARHIDAMQNFPPALANQIIQKHVALQVMPEHYPIVGEYLLRSIREVLGPETATDAVIDAWGSAYGMLANILIGAEGEMYAKLAAAPGGWHGERPFRIAKKVDESGDVTSFYLTPVDESNVLVAKPGQYLTLRATVNDNDIRRNYSLSAPCDGKGYRISIKKVDGGVFSNYMHSLKEGDNLNVFAPCGEFVLSEGAAPVTLVSAGVGITPMVSIATAARAANREVSHVHFARDENTVPLVKEVNANNKHVVTGRPADAAAMMDALRPAVKDDGRDYYLVGPPAFMQSAHAAMIDLGIPAEKINYEFFGPTQVFQK
jgi:nitric oxide dioxygenase